MLLRYLSYVLLTFILVLHFVITTIKNTFILLKGHTVRLVEENVKTEQVIRRSSIRRISRRYTMRASTATRRMTFKESVHILLETIQEIISGEPVLEIKVGSVYYAKVKVPMLGLRLFSLEVTEPNRVCLRVKGKETPMDDNIRFDLDPYSGDLNLTLSENTAKNLNRFGAKLVSSFFIDDAPCLEVKLPFSDPLKIQFQCTPPDE